MSILQLLFGGGNRVDLKEFIEQGAFLVDVRSAAEYAAGHVKGSVNIPLNTMVSELSKFKDKKYIIVFCRSGNRSGQAKLILEQHSFTNVINGGTWEYVNQFIK
ncbi:MAG: rhodanese-like domain-containing protein [Bacteroidota bacterium]